MDDISMKEMIYNFFTTQSRAQIYNTPGILIIRLSKNLFSSYELEGV